MSLRSEIQSALRGAIDTLGETWQYRRRTSGPANPTESRDAWADVVVHATSRATPQEYDEDRRLVKRSEKCQIRISDALADLHAGDQFKDPNGVVWAVNGVASNAQATGTVAYECTRAVPLKAEASDRKSGV